MARLDIEHTVLENAAQTHRKQLVAVVYPEDRDIHAEWVFNSPDPLAQEVLWVHAPSPARMGELYKLFPEHDEWLAFADAQGKLAHLDRVKLPPEPRPAK